MENAPKLASCLNQQNKKPQAGNPGFNDGQVLANITGDMQPHSWRWRVQGGIRADSTGRVPRYLEDMRMINALTIIKLVIEIIAAAMQLIAQYHHLV